MLQGVDKLKGMAYSCCNVFAVTVQTISSELIVQKQMGFANQTFVANHTETIIDCELTQFALISTYIMWFLGSPTCLLIGKMAKSTAGQGQS